MNSHDYSPRTELGAGRFLARLAFAVFLAVAGTLLVLEHRAHLLGAWPLLLVVVVCIGAHFFMHRGHGRGGDHGH